MDFQTPILQDIRDEMLQAQCTEISGLAGGGTTSVRKFRQNEECNDNEAAPQKPLSTLPALFQSRNDLNKIVFSRDVLDALWYIHWL